MALSNGTIGGAEIVSDGILIGSGTDAMILYPVPEDRNYFLQIKIEIDFSDELVIPTAHLSKESGPLVTIKRGWHGGHISANTDFLIGENPSDRFYMNFTLSIVGTIERYAAELRYVILRKAKS